MWAWRQQRAAAHRPLRLLSVEPPLFWDICRRRSWERPATSTSTKTTCSTWQTSTGKVKLPPHAPAHGAPPTGRGVHASHLRSSPKQRENRDVVLQVQKQTGLLHVAPEPVVQLHQPVDQGGGIHSLLKQGSCVSMGGATQHRPRPLAGLLTGVPVSAGGPASPETRRRAALEASRVRHKSPAACCAAADRDNDACLCPQRTQSTSQ